MLRENGAVPLCATGDCEIQDIQDSPDVWELQRLVRAFIQSSSLLESSPAYTRVAERHMEHAGLFAIDLSELLAMQSEWIEWVNEKKRTARETQLVHGPRRRS